MSTSDHLDRIKIKPRQIVMKVSKHKSERSIKEEKHESPKSENNFDNCDEIPEEDGKIDEDKIKSLKQFSF